MLHSKKNEKTPNTFVDGVPVKISEQYKPPVKVTLPFSCQNCTPSDSLYTEYDFRLENRVLDKLTEWKKTHKEELERRKERLKRKKEVCQEVEKFSNLTLAEVEEEVAEPVRPCNPKLDDSILTPVCAKVNSPSNKPTSSLFNLSDFESDNSSPFDNMELKTINDMEVLASILTSDNMKQSFNNNYNIIDKELNKNGLAFSKGNEWHQLPPNGYDNYLVPGYNGSVIPTGYLDNYGPVHTVSENFQLYNFELNNFSNQCGAGVPSGPAASAKQPERHHLDNLIDDTSCADLKLQKANSKSVPDIVSELQKELEESRERDAERRLMTISSGNQKLPESAKQEKKPYRKLSDPTSRLKPELLRLAEHISEMGFPLPRVARACAFFEGDDKKVIEFLLQVQSLEEKNFPGDLVERALHANNFSTEESVKYLNSLMVLLDLGFDEAKVEEALKKTNSDRDKALDMLIS
ncbi:UNVERIFIED_CONTAM: hypothetical protein PYX00_008679 [Menopon gallinae]|uniref:Ubiquitin-associated protein 1 n=1 Tax=Menopon gallinae TaxID=328185 RepID=A0AAW2HQ78_9NEOP